MLLSGGAPLGFTPRSCPKYGHTYTAGRGNGVESAGQRRSRSPEQKHHHTEAPWVFQLGKAGSKRRRGDNPGGCWAVPSMCSAFPVTFWNQEPLAPCTKPAEPGPSTAQSCDPSVSSLVWGRPGPGPAGRARYQQLTASILLLQQCHCGGETRSRFRQDVAAVLWEGSQSSEDTHRRLFHHRGWKPSTPTGPCPRAARRPPKRWLISHSAVL